MQNGELAKKIKLLVEIKPDDDWKQSNLEILASQISFVSGSTIEARKEKLEIRPFEYYAAFISNAFGRIFIRPALSVAVVTAAFLVLAAVSLKASTETVPGDSLYIAKKVSEKTQLALTFSEKEKAKLEISFAGNRTKEIVKIMEQAENQDGVKQDQVEMLTQEFRKEINSSRERLARISVETDQSAGNNNDVKVQAPARQENGEDVQAGQTNAEPEVFSANIDKEEQGIEISEGQKTPPAENADNPKASTTTDSSEQQAETGESAKKLDEAEQLFDSSDYSGTIDKLEEAGEMLDQAKSEGEVKGDFQSASTDATTTQ